MSKKNKQRANTLKPQVSHEYIQDRLRTLEATFQQLSQRRQAHMQQTQLVTEELMRLQGEYRALQALVGQLAPIIEAPAALQELVGGESKNE